MEHTTDDFIIEGSVRRRGLAGGAMSLGAWLRVVILSSLSFVSGSLAAFSVPSYRGQQLSPHISFCCEVCSWSSRRWAERSEMESQNTPFLL